MPRDMQDLSSLAIKPIPLAVEVLSTNHTREVPDCFPLKENAMWRDIHEHRKTPWLSGLKLCCHKPRNYY